MKLVTKAGNTGKPYLYKSRMARNGFYSVALKKTWVKFTASILLVAFLSYDISWAEGFSANLNINIPSQYADIQTSSVARDETIINIQDAHSSLTAQYKIADILDSLSKNYELNTICLEGGEGPCDVSLLRSYPDKKIRSETAGYMMKKGILSAGEFFSIVSDVEHAVIGADDTVLYEENLEMFKKAISIQSEAAADCGILLSHINVLEKERYDRETLDLLNNIRAHRDGEIPLSDYWIYLAKTFDRVKLDMPDLENVRLFSMVNSIEKEINFKKVSDDRAYLLDKLIPKLNREDSEQVVLKSIEFKLGKLDEYSFYAYLLDTSERYGLSEDILSSVRKYAEYMKIYKNIDIFALYSEIKNAESMLIRRLIKETGDRDLYGLYEYIYLIKKMFMLNLTKEESYDLHRAKAIYKDRHIARIIMANPDRMADHVRSIRKSMPVFHKFYRLAEERDKILVQNTINAMRKKGDKVAALITGGYHSGGMADIFKKHQLSYLVVMPKYTDNNERPYVTILTNSANEYKEMFRKAGFHISMSLVFDGKKTAAEFIDMFLYALARSVSEGADFEPAKLNWLKEYANVYQKRQDAGLHCGPVTPRKMSAILRSVDIAPITDDLIIVRVKIGKSGYIYRSLQKGSDGRWDLALSTKEHILRAQRIANSRAEGIKKDGIVKNVTGIISITEIISRLDAMINDNSNSDYADMVSLIKSKLSLSEEVATEQIENMIIRFLKAKGNRIQKNWRLDHQIASRINRISQRAVIDAGLIINESDNKLNKAIEKSEEDVKADRPAQRIEDKKKPKTIRKSTIPSRKGILESRYALPFLIVAIELVALFAASFNIMNLDSPATLTTKLFQIASLWASTFTLSIVLLNAACLLWNIGLEIYLSKTLPGWDIALYKYSRSVSGKIIVEPDFYNNPPLIHQRYVQNALIARHYAKQISQNIVNRLPFNSTTVRRTLISSLSRILIYAFPLSLIFNKEEPFGLVSWDIIGDPEDDFTIRNNLRWNITPLHPKVGFKPFEKRHIVIPDLHGLDPAKLKSILTAAAFIDTNGDITADNTVLVFLGDIIDRGKYSMALLEYINNLKAKAADRNCKVVLLSGNHEHMFYTGLMGDNLGFMNWLKNSAIDGDQHAIELYQDIRDGLSVDDARKRVFDDAKYTDWVDLFSKIKEMFADNTIEAAYTYNEALFMHSFLNNSSLDHIQKSGDNRTVDSIASWLNNTLDKLVRLYTQKSPVSPETADLKILEKVLHTRPEEHQPVSKQSFLTFTGHNPVNKVGFAPNGNGNLISLDAINALKEQYAFIQVLGESVLCFECKARNDGLTEQLGYLEKYADNVRNHEFVEDQDQEVTKEAVQTILDSLFIIRQGIASNVNSEALKRVNLRLETIQSKAENLRTARVNARISRLMRYIQEGDIEKAAGTLLIIEDHIVKALQCGLLSPLGSAQFTELLNNISSSNKYEHYVRNAADEALNAVNREISKIAGSYITAEKYDIRRSQERLKALGFDQVTLKNILRVENGEKISEDADLQSKVEQDADIVREVLIESGRPVAHDQYLLIIDRIIDIFEETTETADEPKAKSRYEVFPHVSKIITIIGIATYITGLIVIGKYLWKLFAHYLIPNRPYIDVIDDSISGYASIFDQRFLADINYLRSALILTVSVLFLVFINALISYLLKSKKSPVAIKLQKLLPIFTDEDMSGTEPPGSTFLIKVFTLYYKIAGILRKLSHAFKKEGIRSAISGMIDQTRDFDPESFNVIYFNKEKELVVTTRERPGAYQRIVQYYTTRPGIESELAGTETVDVRDANNRRFSVLVVRFNIKSINKDIDMESLSHTTLTDHNYAGESSLPNYITSGYFVNLIEKKYIIPKPEDIGKLPEGLSETCDVETLAKNALNTVKENSNLLQANAEYVEPALDFLRVIVDTMDLNGKTGIEGIKYLAGKLQIQFKHFDELIINNRAEYVLLEKSKEALYGQLQENKIPEEIRAYLAKQMEAKESKIENLKKNIQESLLKLSMMKEFWFFSVNPDKNVESYMDETMTINSTRSIGSNTPIILFAETLTPGQIIYLFEHYSVQAIVTQEATLTSHWVIVAKNMKIPVIISTLPSYRTLKHEVMNYISDVYKTKEKDESHRVDINQEMGIVLSDINSNAQVILSPEIATVEAVKDMLVNETAFERFSREFVTKPCNKVRTTMGGPSFRIQANADNEKEIKDAVMQYQADGIGLVRTEYLFDGKNVIGSDKRFPVKDYLAAFFAAESDAKQERSLIRNRSVLKDALKAYFIKLAKAANDLPVTLRMIDFEPDKLTLIHQELKKRNIPFKTGTDFYNTPLGRDILEIELQAAIEAYSTDCGNIKILFPMVSNVNTVQRLITDKESAVWKARQKAMFDLATDANIKAGSKEASLLISKINEVPLGIMIETNEAAANISDLLAIEEIDFYSLGTNDLTRFVMGIFLQELGKNPLGQPLSRDKPEYRQYISRIRTRVLKEITQIMEKTIETNLKRIKDKKAPKSLSVCGEMASWYVFIIFLAHKSAMLTKHIDKTMVDRALPLTLSMSGLRIPEIATFMDFMDEKHYEGISTFLVNKKDKLGDISVHSSAEKVAEKVFMDIYNNKGLNEIYDEIIKEYEHKIADKSEQLLSKPSDEERTLSTLYLMIATNGHLDDIPEAPRTAVTARTDTAEPVTDNEPKNEAPEASNAQNVTVYKTLYLTDPAGIHDRPAHAIIKKLYQLKINLYVDIIKRPFEDAKKPDYPHLNDIISILSLGLMPDTVIRFRVEGPEDKVADFINFLYSPDPGNGLEFDGVKVFQPADDYDFNYHASWTFAGKLLNIRYSPYFHAPVFEELFKVGIPLAIFHLLSKIFTPYSGSNIWSSSFSIPDFIALSALLAISSFLFYGLSRIFIALHILNIGERDQAFKQAPIMSSIKAYNEFNNLNERDRQHIAKLPVSTVYSSFIILLAGITSGMFSNYSFTMQGSELFSALLAFTAYPSGTLIICMLAHLVTAFTKKISDLKSILLPKQATDKQRDFAFVIGVMDIDQSTIEKVNAKNAGDMLLVNLNSSDHEGRLAELEIFRKYYGAYATGVIDAGNLNLKELEDVVSSLIENLKKHDKELFAISNPDLVKLNDKTVRTIKDIDNILHTVMQSLKIETPFSLNTSSLTLAQIRMDKLAEKNTISVLNNANSTLESINRKGAKVVISLKAENAGELYLLIKEYKKQKEMSGSSSYPVKLHVRLTDNRISEKDLGKIAKKLGIGHMTDSVKISLSDDGRHLTDIYRVTADAFNADIEKDIVAIGDISNIIIDNNALLDKGLIVVKGRNCMISQLYCGIIDIIARRGSAANDHNMDDIINAKYRLKISSSSENKWYYFEFEPFEKCDMEQLRLECENYRNVLLSA